jgi:hypothetical protein
VGYNYESRPTLGSTLRTDTQVVVPLMIHEKYAGEFAAGGSGQVNGTRRAPNCSASSRPCSCMRGR